MSATVYHVLALGFAALLVWLLYCVRWLPGSDFIEFLIDLPGELLDERRYRRMLAAQDAREALLVYPREILDKRFRITPADIKADRAERKKAAAERLAAAPEIAS